MHEPANPDLKREISAALDWWREAGVDLDFADAPVPLLAPEAPAAAEAAATAATKSRSASRPPAKRAPAGPAIDLSGLPAELPAFAQWWLSEPTLDGGRTEGRVAPRGRSGAALMILVGDPEEADTDMLLSGRGGQLVGSFLAAAGIDPGEVYYASVLPRPMPHPDWAGIAAAGYGAVLARHISLVRPQRIIAFDGSNLPLTGNDWPNSPDSLRRFNHEDLSIPLLAARGLAVLLERARWKAGLWQGWLDWTREG